MRQRWLLGAYVLLLLSLIAGSEPRRVGDGGEYQEMARAFGRGESPSPRAVHFWAYPLLASPFALVADRVGVDALVGFSVLNFILLTAAWLVVSRRLAWPLSLLLFAGPIVWWIDKAHTEVFSFALLSVALTLLTEAPWWAMVCAGAASTQNPPMAVLIPLAIAASLVTRPVLWRDRRIWTAAGCAAVLALLHPVYYLARLGRLSPLVNSTLMTLPNSDELGAVLWDPNIGLVWAFPGLALALVIGTAGFLFTAKWPSRRAEIFASVTCAAIFLVSVSQTTNFNSGGTHHMSRYGVWFMPLTIPLFRSIWDSGSQSVRCVFRILALGSTVWSVFVFHPGLPAVHLRPTWLAHQVWTRLPSWSNPIPPTSSKDMMRSSLCC